MKKARDRVDEPEPRWQAVLALIAVGGLIPFWIYIFFLYNPR